MSAPLTASVVTDAFTTTTAVISGTTFLVTIGTPSPEPNGPAPDVLPATCLCVEAQSMLQKHGVSQPLCDARFIDTAEACLACFNETANPSVEPELLLLHEQLSTAVEQCSPANSSSNRNKVGAVVGGTIGGIIGWLLLLGVLIFFLRRRKSQGKMVWSMKSLRFWGKAELFATDSLPDSQELDGISITRSLLREKYPPVLLELPVNEEVRRPVVVDKPLPGLRNVTANALSRAVSAPTLRS